MKNSKYCIYFDLDGVLTDFNKRYHDFFGKYPFENKAQPKNNYYYDLPRVFWSEMEWLIGGKELFNFCYSYFKNIKILSSAGIKRNLMKNFTIYEKIKNGKLEWIKNNIPQIDKNDIYITPSSGIKAIFSGTNRILIDDKPAVILLWEKFGGIGILHDKDNFHNSIAELKKYI